MTLITARHGRRPGCWPVAGGITFAPGRRFVSLRADLQNRDRHPHATAERGQDRGAGQKQPFQRPRNAGHALIPALPAALGVVAVMALFWVGHLGVRQAVGDATVLAEAEAHVALALVVDDAEVHLARAQELLNSAGEAGMVEQVTELVSNHDAPPAERLSVLVELFEQRRARVQHGAEVRFLSMAAVGLALLLTTAACSAFLWHRRWSGRWRRVRRLSDAVQALAHAPLDARFSPSGVTDELGRIEQVLAQVAPQLADNLVHQQRLSLLGEQVAFVAHDIRNPLGTITMGLSMLRDNAAGPELQELLVAESRRANALADELRNFARRSNSVQLCDLACEIEASTRLVNGRASKAGVTVATGSGSAAVMARGNELRQVLINLLENAIDAAAGSRGRRVEVRAFTEGEVAVITVEDSGPGVPAPERARLFESFYTSKKDGSGMGLAITRRIVETLGGTVELEESAALGGASFVVRLPSADSARASQVVAEAAIGA